MCIPRLPDESLGGKPPNDNNSSRRIEGWSAYGARQDAVGGRHEAPAPPLDYVRGMRYRELFQGSLDSSLGQRAGVIPAADRRSADRLLLIGAGQSSIILSPWERQVARSQLVQAERCGEAFVALRGYECRPDGDRELRMCVQKKCGTRRCDDCDEVIRRHQMHRSDGPWRLFFTLTLPRNGTARQAWRGIHKLIRAWHRELRRELAISRRRWPEKGERRWMQRQARITRAQARIRGTGKLDFAWVLEAHKDAWPHVHECVSLEWLEYGWARALWRRIVRDKRARIDGQKVWNKDGVCKYLSMYVAKARLAPEIVAILKGRRVWASTVPVGDVPESEWSVEESTSSDMARLQVEQPEFWGRIMGWNLEASKDSAYAKWWRPAPARPEPVLVSREDDPDGWVFDGAPTRRKRDERTPKYVEAVLAMIESDQMKRHDSC